VRGRRRGSTERAHFLVRKRGAHRDNAPIAVQVPDAGHEEAPGEDRGFVAEEESEDRNASDALVDPVTPDQSPT
jgi:hypothetical protein